MITSPFYFVLLAGSVILFWVIPRNNLRIIFLALTSLAIVSYWDHWAGVIVIILSSFSFGIAKAIENGRHKTLIHKCGVVVLVLLLFTFKYLGFLDQTFNSLLRLIHASPSSFSINDILPPLGISYIVFKLISYITDVLWGVVKPGRYIDVLCYSSLFTIFAAGPIERFERLKPQLENKEVAFKAEFIEVGIRRIIYGLFKKLVISDWIAFFIGPILKSTGEIPSTLRMIALVGFSIQIYTDFSGYSDIAIGSSKLFGLTIMENFNWPYLSTNMSKFWRSWHISLSDWIRDYLFFPLCRWSDKTIWIIFFVPLIAMGLCGLWHGASWNFVLWGMWHGLGIASVQVWHRYRIKSWIIQNNYAKAFISFFSAIAYLLNSL